MSDQKNHEKPEVYALHQNGGAWQISRRDFLKAAGAGAAALGAGLNSRFVRPAYAEESLEELCKSAPAHKESITDMFASADGKYLVTMDSNQEIKCWDFENFSLLGTKKKSSVGVRCTVGMFNDEPCLVYYDNKDNMIKGSVLPEMGSASDTKVYIGWAVSDVVRDLVLGRRGDIYLTLLNQANAGKKTYRIGKVEKGSGGKKYQNSDNSLYSDSEDISSMILIDNEQKALMKTGGSRFRIVDLINGSSEDPDIPEVKPSTEFCTVPGDTAVLFAESNSSMVAAHYGLFSLKDGSMIWTQNISGPKPDSPVIVSTAVTPDGSMGILLGKKSKQMIWLISMSDGSVKRQLEIGDPSDSCSKIIVSGDGSKFAVANGKSVLFISLPDLKLIGCPVDLDIMKDNVKGIEIQRTDQVTGRIVTYTLPCGSPIPAGAVCTCNCVAGRVPSCSCVGHVSKPGGGGGGGGHYWHPN